MPRVGTEKLTPDQLSGKTLSNQPRITPKQLSAAKVASFSVALSPANNLLISAYLGAALFTQQFIFSYASPIDYLANNGTASAGGGLPASTIAGWSLVGLTTAVGCIGILAQCYRCVTAWREERDTETSPLLNNPYPSSETPSIAGSL